MIKAIYVGLLAISLGTFVGCTADNDEESKPDLIFQSQIDALKKTEQVEGMIMDSAEKKRKEIEEQGI